MMNIPNWLIYSLIVAVGITFWYCVAKWWF